MSKWARKEDEKEYKLSEESAEKAVRELLDFYEVDTARNDPDQERALDENFDVLMKAYRRGDLENSRDDDKGFCVIQHLKNAHQGNDKITYREMGGKDRIVMEGFDQSKFISRTYAILGKLSGYGEDAIMKLKARDWQVAKTLSFVFIMASFG